MRALTFPFCLVRSLLVPVGPAWIVALGVTVGSGAALAASTGEKRFLQENDAAMSRMMADMAVKPSGDVDEDFVAMMVPHHQGAIDMAQAELRHGSNEQLRRIAQEIIVEQQQEITAMRLALGQPLPPSVAAPDQQTPAPQATTPPVDSGKPAKMPAGMKMN
jgi:hypothetical protein